MESSSDDVAASIIPPNVWVLLWDVDRSKLSLSQHFKYIIERILEYGDIAEVKWMETHFSRTNIVDTLKHSKRISAKSGNFFRLIYDIPREDLECLRKPYMTRQERF